MLNSECCCHSVRSSVESATRDLWRASPLSTSPTWRIIFQIVHDRDKFSNREQAATNRNDENATCDYIYPNIYECVSGDMNIHHDRF